MQKKNLMSIKKSPYSQLRNLERQSKKLPDKDRTTRKKKKKKKKKYTRRKEETIMSFRTIEDL
jgi:hypothetical protein